jgi:hypothetical protein
MRLPRETCVIQTSSAYDGKNNALIRYSGEGAKLRRYTPSFPPVDLVNGIVNGYMQQGVLARSL